MYNGLRWKWFSSPRIIVVYPSHGVEPHVELLVGRTMEALDG